MAGNHTAMGAGTHSSEKASQPAVEAHLWPGAA